MDEMDLKILRTLQKHPDLAVADLAEQVGLSHTPCWRRLKRLQSTGVIERNAVILSPKKLGLEAVVFASIRLKQHDEATLDAFETAVRNRPQIVECFSMSGDSDYQLRIVVANIEAYHDFLKKTLLHLPGVASVNSHFALNMVKLTTDLPI